MLWPKVRKLCWNVFYKRAKSDYTDIRLLQYSCIQTTWHDGAYANPSSLPSFFTNTEKNTTKNSSFVGTSTTLGFCQ